VTQAAREIPDVPVWARQEAFPESPPGWGWVDPKGRRHPCDSAPALISAIRDDRDARVVLTWTPDHPHMIVPEEVPGAADAVLAARKRFAADDLLDSLDKLRWFGFLLGGIALYMFYQGWSRVPGDADSAGRLVFAVRAVTNSMSVGITLLMFLIFAFIPWYQARKRLREFDHWTAENVASVVPALRFETWLQAQKAPVTRLLLGLIGLVGLAQLLPGDSLQAAGLVKPAYHAGQWWRLLTAPFLHGNLIHFLLNAAALLYLGKRVEVFARWPHVPLVFLFSACVGGELSARFVPATSVGASGGLMGWLGFLLVFESLHSRLVPRSARRRLLAGVLLTAVIGLVGYRFIDNAAHAGGLIAGMLYAIVVFPKSASSYRPNTTISDRIAGVGALALLVLAALFAVRLIAIP
jgi:membrane associated rhomboid family serine protease